MDDRTRTELEAAAYRKLVDHLRTRTDVQNIDLMILAGIVALVVEKKRNPTGRITSYNVCYTKLLRLKGKS